VAQRQRLIPTFEQASVRLGPPSTRNGIQVRWLYAQRRIVYLEDAEHIGIEVEVSFGHEINNANAYPLLQECRTLRREKAAVFSPILVCRAYELNGCNLSSCLPFIRDANFVLVRFKGFHSP